MQHSHVMLKQLETEEIAITPTAPLPDVIEKRDQIRSELAEQLSTSATRSPTLAAGLARVTEAGLIIATSLAIALLYPGYGREASLMPYAIVGLAAAVIFVTAMELGKGYKLFTLLNPKPMLSNLFAAWLGTVVTIFALVLFTKEGESFSRLWLLTWMTSGAFFMIAGRFFIAAALRVFNDEGQFNRRTLLIGGGDDAIHVIETLKASPESGSSIIGIFDDRHGNRSPENLGDIAKLGTVNEVVEFVRRARIDTIIVTLPLTAEARLNAILDQLWILPVDIRLSAHAQKVRYRPYAYSYIGNLPCLDVYDRPLGDWGNVLKTIEDKIIASIALVFLAPVMLATALAVKWDSKGPVLFKQKRYGFNNELIEVYKFRSMFTDQSDARADRLVTKGDPRVTRVGRIIRKTSLDELPQLFNVLSGELSLVGPRSHATAAKAAGSLYEKVVDGYFGRHKVKPGITGWAQINGWRGETDTEEKIQRRVEHDLYYIENWSLTFDLYILARTPLSLLKTESAY